jgi:DNA mismatch repair ATPase MutL
LSSVVRRPQRLELTASDEIALTDNLDIIRKNGFDVESREPGEGRDQGGLVLTAKPLSKGTVFDVTGERIYTPATVHPRCQLEFAIDHDHLFV